MTELEKKAEEYIKNKNWSYNQVMTMQEDIIQSYKDGYEQGQKDFDADVTKILNSYGVTFIDTNSIGGLIGLHQLMLDLEKENEELKAKLKGFENGEVAWQGDMDMTIKQNLELKAQIEKMKNCQNCKNKKEDCYGRLICDFKDIYNNKIEHCINNNKWELDE